MKKAITLILLFALLAGLAFANEEETHTIRLKSEVESVRPVIQLKITSVNGNSSNQAATNNANDGNGNVFDGTNIYSYDGTVEIFSINEGGTVTFQAVLKNETNTNEVYQLSFGGGVFTGVSRYGEENGVRGPEMIKTSVGTVIDDSRSGKGIQSIALGAGDTTNKPVIVSFLGPLDKDVTYRDDVILAVAEYIYPEDKTINSNTYYADVTLTVSLV